jgi:hypothetical protein
MDKVGATLEADRSLCVALNALKPAPALGVSLHGGDTVLVVQRSAEELASCARRLRVPSANGVRECEGVPMAEGGLRFEADGRSTYVMCARPQLTLTASLLYYALVPHVHWDQAEVEHALTQRQQIALTLGGNNIVARYPWPGTQHGHAPHLRPPPVQARAFLSVLATLSPCAEVARAAVAALPTMYATQMHGNHMLTSDDTLLIKQLGMHCTFDTLSEQ